MSQQDYMQKEINEFSLKCVQIGEEKAGIHQELTQADLQAFYERFCIEIDVKIEELSKTTTKYPTAEEVLLTDGEVSETVRKEAA